MLGVNSSLCVIGVGFQLYGQLKKSPHNSMGVLGSSAVLTASQTTRLGKGSSVTMRDNACLGDSITVRSTSSGFLNMLLSFLLVF